MRAASWDRKPSEWQVMSHFPDQDEFCAGNGFSGRSPSTDVTHAVGDAVDHEGGDIEMSQAFGPIAGGDPRDPLTSDRRSDRRSGRRCGLPAYRLHSRRSDIWERRRRGKPGAFSEMTSSRVTAGGPANRSRSTSGEDCPTDKLPVVDIIQG